MVPWSKENKQGVAHETFQERAKSTCDQSVEVNLDREPLMEFKKNIERCWAYNRDLESELSTGG